MAIRKSMAETSAPVITSARATWKGQMLFSAGKGERTHAIDGNSKEAPSPVETLLNALACCAGSDVFEFMEKRRTPMTRMDIDVVGTRRVEFPRRLMQLQMTFTIDGPTIEREQAERAIRVSFETYCTVAASLAGDIELTSVLVLNGEKGDPVSQQMFSATFPER